MRSVCLCVGNNTSAAATLVSTQTDAPLFLHTVALKTQFIRSYKEVFSFGCSDAFCDWAVLSLPQSDCVCPLTTSSTRAADMLLQPAMKRHKEPFEWMSVKTSDETEQHWRKKRGHHSDFILFTSTFSSMLKQLCDTRREFYIIYKQNHMPAIFAVCFTDLNKDVYTTWQHKQSSANRTQV